MGLAVFQSGQPMEIGSNMFIVGVEDLWSRPDQHVVQSARAR